MTTNNRRINCEVAHPYSPWTGGRTDMTPDWTVTTKEWLFLEHIKQIRRLLNNHSSLASENKRQRVFLLFTGSPAYNTQRYGVIWGYDDAHTMIWSFSITINFEKSAIGYCSYSQRDDHHLISMLRESYPRDTSVTDTSLQTLQQAPRLLYDH